MPRTNHDCNKGYINTFGLNLTYLNLRNQIDDSFYQTFNYRMYGFVRAVKYLTIMLRIIPGAKKLYFKLFYQALID